MSTWLVVSAVALAVVVAMWALLTAQRLNRLHIRTDAALQNLGHALDHRASLAEVLLGADDPGLAAAAERAQAVEVRWENLAERVARERELAALVDAHFASDSSSLAAANARVEMAMRFYNDAVRVTRGLRLRPMVRLFRLGGTAKLPKYFEETHRAAVSHDTMGESDS
ncbi:hypothetical protein [Corynebacterium atypicum]|uniref:hypothetical protein n=1 Tax=Corynebacterium atypicum TaxID=191610 RepID=UPI000690D7E1|nr:hypothetical protein [Corynebacterium atypicum]